MSIEVLSQLRCRCCGIGEYPHCQDCQKQLEQEDAQAKMQEEYWESVKNEWYERAGEWH